MARRKETFGGVWTRPPAHGRGHSQKQLQDRASFDNQKSEGCGGIFLIATIAVVRIAWQRR